MKINILQFTLFLQETNILPQEHKFKTKITGMH